MTSGLWACPGFVDTYSLRIRGHDAQDSTPVFPPELRRRLVELVRAGQTPEELARKYEPSAGAISRASSPSASVTQATSGVALSSARGGPTTRGSRARTCPVPGHPCLDDLAVDEVLAAVERLMGDEELWRQRSSAGRTWVAARTWATAGVAVSVVATNSARARAAQWT